MLIFISVLLVLILIALVVIMSALLAIALCLFPDPREVNLIAPVPPIRKVRNFLKEMVKETEEKTDDVKEVPAPERDLVYSPSKDTRNENKGYRDDFYED